MIPMPPDLWEKPGGVPMNMRASFDVAQDKLATGLILSLLPSVKHWAGLQADLLFRQKKIFLFYASAPVIIFFPIRWHRLLRRSPLSSLIILWPIKSRTRRFGKIPGNFARACRKPVLLFHQWNTPSCLLCWVTQQWPKPWRKNYLKRGYM